MIGHYSRWELAKEQDFEVGFVELELEPSFEAIIGVVTYFVDITLGFIRVDMFDKGLITLELMTFVSVVMVIHLMVIG